MRCAWTDTQSAERLDGGKWSDCALRAPPEQDQSNTIPLRCDDSSGRYFGAALFPGLVVPGHRQVIVALSAFTVLEKPGLGFGLKRIRALKSMTNSRPSLTLTTIDPSRRHPSAVGSLTGVLMLKL
jgi:hypothetical protein